VAFLRHQSKVLEKDSAAQKESTIIRFSLRDDGFSDNNNYLSRISDDGCFLLDGKEDDVDNIAPSKQCADLSLSSSNKHLVRPECQNTPPPSFTFGTSPTCVAQLELPPQELPPTPQQAAPVKLTTHPLAFQRVRRHTTLSGLKEKTVPAVAGSLRPALRLALRPAAVVTAEKTRDALHALPDELALQSLEFLDGKDLGCLHLAGGGLFWSQTPQRTAEASCWALEVMLTFTTVVCRVSQKTH